MSELLSYTSYATGRRVGVQVELTETGAIDYSFNSDSNISQSDQMILSEEARNKAKIALDSKILLG